MNVVVTLFLENFKVEILQNGDELNDIVSLLLFREAPNALTPVRTSRLKYTPAHSCSFSVLLQFLPHLQHGDGLTDCVSLSHSLLFKQLKLNTKEKTNILLLLIVYIKDQNIAFAGHQAPSTIMIMIYKDQRLSFLRSTILLLQATKQLQRAQS